VRCKVDLSFHILNIRGVDARKAGALDANRWTTVDVEPSMFAGHSVLCPYEVNNPKIGALSGVVIRAVG